MLRKSNKAADALSMHPINSDSSAESDSNVENEDLIVLSYSSLCENIASGRGHLKISYMIKKEAQSICNVNETE